MRAWRRSQALGDVYGVSLRPSPRGCAGCLLALAILIVALWAAAPLLTEGPFSPRGRRDAAITFFGVSELAAGTPRWRAYDLTRAAGFSGDYDHWARLDLVTESEVGQARSYSSTLEAPAGCEIFAASLAEGPPRWWPSSGVGLTVVGAQGIAFKCGSCLWHDASRERLLSYGWCGG
ncbi:MAG: hypothetical protein ABI609_03515 [Acidobacteriota bacterium]